MRASTISLFIVLLAGCAAGPPPVPYPAFITVDELPDAFVAGMPGVRAKQLSLDPHTQRASHRMLLPADWSFTTGASPAHSVEIYVMAGSLTLGEFQLDAGGYAWIPSGSPGLNLSTENGAVILHFTDDADPATMIQTPLITNARLVSWRAEAPGVYARELRFDPGSGARTWLMQIGLDALPSWQRDSQPIEGYLLSGESPSSECSGDVVVTDVNLPGSYFHRPPGAAYALPATAQSGTSIWYLRTVRTNAQEPAEGC